MDRAFPPPARPQRDVDRDFYHDSTLLSEPQTIGPDAAHCTTEALAAMATTTALLQTLQSANNQLDITMGSGSSLPTNVATFANPAESKGSQAKWAPTPTPTNGAGAGTGVGIARPHRFRHRHPYKSRANSDFCYRHDPDVTCRRQLHGPTMESLQTELTALPESDQQGITHMWSQFSAAPPATRELILQGMLAQCCFPQLSFVSASIRDLLKVDFLSALPPELGLRILCFLDPSSLSRAAQVSKNWRDFADDDVVWHRMCEQHIDRKCTKCGWGLPLLDRQRIRTEKKLLQLRLGGAPRHKPIIPPAAIPDSENPYHSTAYMSDDSEENEDSTTKADTKKRTHGTSAMSRRYSSKKVCTPESNYATDQAYFQSSLRPWKDVYRDRFRVGTNWKYGRSSIKVLRGHTNGVMCVQFNDKILVSGSYDSTLKIWDLETGLELRTLTGHTLGVRCLQFDATKLVSGSLDGTLKMWDMRSGKVVRTFPGHSGGVISLHFDGMILASGSQDKTIRVRDFQNCSRVVLRGHTDWVNAIKVHAASQSLFSASDDCTVRMWDLEAKRCVRVFNDHVGQVQQVLPLPLDFELPEPDENNGEQDIPQTPTVESMKTLSLPDVPGRSSHPRYMLTAGLDSTVRLWDVSTGRCVRTLFGHNEGVWALVADTLRIVSGSNDAMVKIWDPRTGKCERTISGHSGPVTCIGLSDRRMCTGSEDHTIRLYDYGAENL